jgi:hypothetical protein
MVTIEQALEAFVEDQRQRLSARTMRSYDDVVELLRHSLNGYGPNALDRGERRRWEKAFESGDEDAFCHLFGPERILEHLPEFLGYFMIRKVSAGQELLRSAGTVTKRLAEWLYQRGYVSDEERAEAVERGTRSSRDLPRAQRLARLLCEQSRAAPPCDPDMLGSDDLIEDYLVIERVEPGELYFSDGVGPLTVSAQACELAEVGWGVAATLARLAKIWWVVEVGNVYPR